MLDASGQNQQRQQHDPNQRLATTSTNDLVTELLTRYEELLLIGCNPTDTVNIAGKDVKQPPAIDVRSKLGEHTNLTNHTLVGILTRLLAGVRNKLSPSPAVTN